MPSKHPGSGSAGSHDGIGHRSWLSCWADRAAAAIRSLKTATVPSAGAQEEAKGRADSPERETSGHHVHQPGMPVVTELQLGRQSYKHWGPSVFALYASAAFTPEPDDSADGNMQLSPTAGTAATSTSSASNSILLRSVSVHRPLPAVKAVLQQCEAVHIESGNVEGIGRAASSFIAQTAISETFYVYDLGEVAHLYAQWRLSMPRVQPFFAVKCNPEPVLLAMLNALGAGFDCASITELQAAAALGVAQERIIFANPCKRPADFRYAVAHGVQTTTFDCPSELHKIAAQAPGFRCVLRIRCDDRTAKLSLGVKYGAEIEEVPGLLATAQQLGLQVVGVSFHVGSGCQNVGVYGEAIASARKVFDLAAAAGFPPLQLLDVGGGFTAPHDDESSRLFYDTARVINGSIDRWFPESSGVRIIAEPGRFFAETSATLFTTILGHRQGRCEAGQPVMDYWISDGCYGSFRIQVVVDGLQPSYLVLRSPLLPPAAAGAAEAGQAAAAAEQTAAADQADPAALLASRLFGTSGKECDSVHTSAHVPLLRTGDWLMFPYAGAYTVCAASNFGGHGCQQPARLFVYSAEAEEGQLVAQQSGLLHQYSSLAVPDTILEDAVLETGEGDAAAAAEAAAAAADTIADASAVLSRVLSRRHSSLQRSVSLTRVPSGRRG